jgi:hypothetical protein
VRGAKALAACGRLCALPRVGSWVALVVGVGGCQAVDLGGASPPSEADAAVPTSTACTAPPSSCWVDAVHAAAACLPPSAEQGTFRADGRTCAYASGATVTFATAPTPAASLPSFVVETNGTICVNYQAFVEGFVLTTSTGMTTVAADTGTLHVTCPDGGFFATPLPSAVPFAQVCGGEVPDVVPTISTAGVGGVDGGEDDDALASSATEVSASLLGAWGPAPVRLFDCVAP